MARLFERLKSTKLIQWALAYAAGAWALLEGADVVGGQFHWPGWLLQSLTVLLGVGFFVTLVIAWYHGDRGRQRVSGSEVLLLVGLLVVASAALIWIRQGAVAQREAGRNADASGPSRSAVERGNPAVAVLPFANISPDPSDAFFADGIHEEIITHLTRIPGLDVISRTSVLPYAAEAKPVHEIAAELGVDVVLEGSARRAGDGVRVTAQLVDGPSDTPVWTEEFDRTWSVDGLFAIQTEIAEHIADALAVRLTAEDRGRLTDFPTGSIEAYEAYLRGTAAWLRWTEAGFEEALRHFRRAIELDPSFAQPHAGLADAYGLLAYFGVLAPRDAQPLSRAEALAALELDSLLAEGHLALGMYHLNFDRDWAEAGRRIERAVALAPSDPLTHWAYSVFLNQAGDFEGSRRAIERALELDPHSTNLWNAKGWVELGEGNAQDALASAETMLEMDGSSWSGFWLKGAALRVLGDEAAARPELEEAVALSGGLAGPKASLAQAAAAQGDLEAARAILAELLAARKVGYVPATQVARVYEALGEVDEAIRWMEVAYEEGDGFLHFANRWPRYEALRADPRFQALLSRMHLPE